MMVMMTAMTPSEKASSRAGVERWWRGMGLSLGGRCWEQHTTAIGAE